jgi:hypothetical protein
VANIITGQIGNQHFAIHWGGSAADGALLVFKTPAKKPD